jgi:hypothetical protein
MPDNSLPDDDVCGAATDRGRGPERLGAILRREALYSSTLTD